MSTCRGLGASASGTRSARLGVVAVATMLLAPPAEAQTEFMFRGFGDVGSTTFAAEKSFSAVLGSETGRVFGGGVEAVLPQRVFVNVRASRFREVGQRVFLFNGQQFNLGIPTTITVTPVELTGGYRFDFGRRLVPYGGAGLGWHRYEETSRFAEASENVNERFTGYHVVGGAEVRLARWIGAAAEVQWATVPDALGDDPNSVSHEFDESDLGGVTFRFKVVVGR
ncbi:MAG: outer membrane beta-barrel protein [Acidobacteria bacterium]|nr:outer membrane beta-barrel protein [Acidobacteriota bacterium]